ncbi:MAG: DsbA family protein [Haloferacaceae archaeon]
MDGVSRRGALAAVVAASGVVAGCVGGGTGDGSADGDPPSLDSHPAGRDVDEQPRFGPPPGDGRGTIVAFEDPSCPRCAAFERETVPRIRSALADPGDATFVFRLYPNVSPWGKPASRALEATYARDADAHWALADRYFSTQSAFDGENVLDRTRTFLDAETTVDGAAVVSEVRSGDADSPVEADVAAATDAGVNATPTVFLFRGGTYRTKVVGSVSYAVVTNALGL